MEINKKIIVILLCLASILYLGLQSKKYQIKMISHFSEFQMQSIECSNALVLFDVDETLITLPERFNFSWPFRLRVLWNFPQFLNKQTWEHVYSQLWQQAQFMLIEPKAVQLIQQLKSHGCIVLGLTSMESGSYGIIPDMPEWRFNTLAQFGVEFTQTFGDYTFTNLTSYRDNYPVLHKGILCANKQPKGEVLKAFLEHFRLRPKKIIFFEDNIENLQSIGKACAQLGIPVELYQYKGAENIQSARNVDRIFNKIKNLVE